MDKIITINGVKYKKVAGFECNECDLKRDDISVGFCGGLVAYCGDFHYEVIKECNSCNSYGGNKLICSKCHNFDMWRCRY